MNMSYLGNLWHLKYPPGTWILCKWVILFIHPALLINTLAPSFWGDGIVSPLRKNIANLSRVIHLKLIYFCFPWDSSIILVCGEEVGGEWKESREKMFKSGDNDVRTLRVTRPLPGLFSSSLTAGNIMAPTKTSTFWSLESGNMLLYMTEGRCRCD